MTFNFRQHKTATSLLAAAAAAAAVPPLLLIHVAAADPNSDLPVDSSPSPYLGIIFLFLTAFIIFCAIVYYYLRERYLSRRRRRLLLHLAAASAHRALEEAPTRGGLDPDLVKAFPLVTYSEARTKYVSTGPDCVVCLSAFEDHETLRLLPKCGHLFHPDCVGVWLASHATCPCCRADLMKEVPSNRVVVDVETTLQCD